MTRAKIIAAIAIFFALAGCAYSDSVNIVELGEGNFTTIGSPKSLSPAKKAQPCKMPSISFLPEALSSSAETLSWKQLYRSAKTLLSAAQALHGFTAIKLSALLT